MKKIDLKQAIHEAEDHNTSPSRLTEIYSQYSTIDNLIPAYHPETPVRYALSKNPNTPIEILIKLSGEFPVEFINNPTIDFYLFHESNFIADIPLHCLSKIVCVQEISIELIFLALDYLSKDLTNDEQIKEDAEEPDVIVMIISNHLDKWNQWRSNNNDKRKRISLIGIDLSSLNLENAKLNNLDLR